MLQRTGPKRSLCGLYLIPNLVILVTARHVLSGREPFEDALISPNGYIPNQIRVFPTISGDGVSWIRAITHMDLYDNDRPVWIEDPEFAELRTDIAVLPFGADSSLQVRCINDEPDLEKELFTRIGFECSIVGYPFHDMTGLMTPIWRRATIASEPYLPVDNKPMFLLDATTSPGFSGSPVFRVHIGPLPVPQPDGSIQVYIEKMVSVSFVGVYAGRLQHKHIGGEVPFVFYGNRLARILSNPI